jgi:hypothetical protein
VNKQGGKWKFEVREKAQTKRGPGNSEQFRRALARANGLEPTFPLHSTISV